MSGRFVGSAGLMVVLAAVVGASGFSQEPGEKFALLVGVRKYDPNELRSLPYSEADVTELAQVLKSGGYKPGNVVLMTQTAGADKFIWGLPTNDITINPNLKQNPGW